MCPIVPMFMCGLERSNFSFAMCSYVSSRIITSTSLGRCSVLERSILLGLTFHRPSESRVKADWSSSGSLRWQHFKSHRCNVVPFQQHYRLGLLLRLARAPRNGNPGSDVVVGRH